MNTRTIVPVAPPEAVAIPPGSKSITNRALLLAALAEGTTVLEGVLESEDTQLMSDALVRLGVSVEHERETNKIILAGTCGMFPNRNAEIPVGNSGTTARFLAAALCFSEGTYRISGKPRMHRRPIRDLTDALRQWGGSIRCENDDDCPPVLITPWKQGAGTDPLIATVRGSVSSQYLSALLMAAPCASRYAAVEIRIAGPLVSRPYVDMTLEMLRRFGAPVAVSDDFSVFRFEKNSTFRSPGTWRIEPDASAASYFFAAAAILGGTVRVPGLSADSLQGDVRFVDCLEKMGCRVRYDRDAITVSRDPSVPLRGISIDMNAISDTAQTLAAVALFAEEPTEITHIEHVRFKETDRITDLATELRKFGATVHERRDGLLIEPPERLVPATVDTYDDHRMAMSLALVGLRLEGVKIRDPQCVQKTFPDYFQALEQLGDRDPDT